MTACRLHPYEEWTGVRVEYGRTVLIIDPGRGRPCRFGSTRFAGRLFDRADMCLLTHFHHDHYARLKRVESSGVIAGEFTAFLLKKCFDDREVVTIEPYGEVVVGDVSVRCVPVEHTCHEALAFVLEPSDGSGPVVLYTGDWWESPEELTSKVSRVTGTVDVLITEAAAVLRDDPGNLWDQVKRVADMFDDVVYLVCRSFPDVVDVIAGAHGEDPRVPPEDAELPEILEAAGVRADVVRGTSGPVVTVNPKVAVGVASSRGVPLVVPDEMKPRIVGDLGYEGRLLTVKIGGHPTPLDVIALAEELEPEILIIRHSSPKNAVDVKDGTDVGDVRVWTEGLMDPGPVQVSG